MKSLDAQAVTAALGGRWTGQTGRAFCPAHSNTQTPALSIGNGKHGIWVKCFAGCAAKDVFAALRKLKLVSNTARPTIGKRSMTETHVVWNRTTYEQVEKASRFWNECQPISGTPAETYLLHRGIRTPGITDSLRFSSSVLHGPTGKRTPAMVGAIENGGLLIALHLTFLTRDGRKSEDEPAKMMRGPVSGGAVKLLKTGKNLIVGEGIETSLTLAEIASSRPENYQVWAALSSGGMERLRLPAEPATLWIGADGDRAGRKAANMLARRALLSNWQVYISSAPDGLDWNDMMIRAGG